MNLWQTLKLAWVNIIGNKMRSFLTMLGIIIGVGSVIALVSLMQGMIGQEMDTYAKMGINDVMISIVGRNGDKIIDEEDMFEYAEQHSDTIRGITPLLQKNYEVTLKAGNQTAEYENLSGVDESYLELKGMKIAVGRKLTFSDMAVRNKVCVIGSYINNILYGGNASPGDLLYMNGEEMKVIGILEEMSGGMQYSADDMVYLPYTVAVRMANGGGEIGTYQLITKDSSVVTQVTQEMRDYLYGIFRDKKAYSIQDNSSSLESINASMNMMTMLLGGIAGISLLVAGIGIMNIMLVSVTERTKEIGIRKSLGARRKDIRRQFILEAGMTSSLGGLIGIILGNALTIKLSGLIGFSASANMNTVLLAFGISVGIGVLFGFLPANRAAKLNPIDALRNE